MDQVGILHILIKAASPFAHRHIAGLADGYSGYVPTPAITEGLR
jgi:hypothetical protein